MDHTRRVMVISLIAVLLATVHGGRENPPVPLQWQYSSAPSPYSLPPHLLINYP